MFFFIWLNSTDYGGKYWCCIEGHLPKFRRTKQKHVGSDTDQRATQWAHDYNVHLLKRGYVLSDRYFSHRLHRWVDNVHYIVHTSMHHYGHPHDTTTSNVCLLYHIFRLRWPLEGSIFFSSHNILWRNHVWSHCSHVHRMHRTHSDYHVETEEIVCLNTLTTPSLPSANREWHLHTVKYENPVMRRLDGWHSNPDVLLQHTHTYRMVGMRADTTNQSGTSPFN